MARFGPIMQNGFVVADLDAALDHWTRVMGVGPFYVIEHIPFEATWFRGAPTEIDLTVAIGNWGELQIELILQHNDAPSIYTTFDEYGRGGLQHMGVLTDSVDADLAALAADGIAPVQHGRTRTGMRFAYLSTDFHPGGMIELIESGPAVQRFFAMVRDASRDWDGRDAVRRL